MIQKIVIAIALLLSLAVHAETTKEEVKFNLTGVSVSQVMQIIFGDALKAPSVLDPGVANDQRVITFRWSSDKGDVRVFLAKFLDSLGYAIEQRNGIDFVAKRRTANRPKMMCLSIGQSSERWAF